MSLSKYSFRFRQKELENDYRNSKVLAYSYSENVISTCNDESDELVLELNDIVDSCYIGKLKPAIWNVMFESFSTKLYPTGFKQNVLIENGTVSFPTNSIVHDAFALTENFKLFPCGLVSKQIYRCLWW